MILTFYLTKANLYDLPFHVAHVVIPFIRLYFWSQ